MEKKSKYMFLVLKERNGEYEYYHKNLHELPNARKTTMKKYAEDYIKGFYGGPATKEDEGYYFHGGEVFVKIYSYQIISEAEYNVLRKYL